MWIIFLLSAAAFGLVALLILFIGHKIYIRSSLRGLSLDRPSKNRYKYHCIPYYQGGGCVIIKTIKYGSGVIRIHDDYSKDKTHEENQKIVDEVSKLIIGFYRREAAG